MEKLNMYYKSIALKVPELHVNPHKLAAFKVSDGSTRSKGTIAPKQRNKFKVRSMLRIKLTQVDKYLRPLKTRRIYTHTVLVTITQTNPDERTHRQKNHSVSPSISSSPTKVTLECSDTNTQRSGGNTHETYTFSNIWDTQETEYRHLVMQTKTTGKSQKKNVHVMTAKKCGNVRQKNQV